MMNYLATVILLTATVSFSLADPGDKWSLLKSYDFSSMEQVRKDWDVVLWPPGFVNGELEAYVDSPDNIYVENGNVVVRAVHKPNSCIYMTDSDVGGDTIMEILTPTKEACCDACNKVQTCKGFAWVRQNGGACYLKGQTYTYKHTGVVAGICAEYTSGRLHSKQLFTPVNSPGKKLKVEFVAKVPTVKGAWPALWLLGIENVYGIWPQEGEIDIMEWVWQIQNDTKSSLHWASGNDWSTDFTQQSMAQVASQWTTYGVEYSALSGDEYVQFYVITAAGKTLMGKRALASEWADKWFPTPACGTANSKGPCTPLAPYDNQVYAIINLAVGGQWGGCCGVNGDYSAFEKGVIMPVKSLKVYQNAYVPTLPPPTYPSPNINWKLAKNYDMTNIQSVLNDWDFVLWPAGKVNNEWEAYVDSPQSLSVSNGAMNIKAFIQPANGTCQMLGQYDIGYGANLANIGNKKSGDCCSICAGRKGCVAWVWSSYAGGTCWLKSTLTGITKKNGVISGIMGQIVSTRLSSKAKWSPTQPNPGGKLRVEVTAKIPTIPGAWPAFWMLGEPGVYGNWPQLGEIDIMEWVYQLRSKTQSTLHWKSGGEDWGTAWNELSAKALSSEYNTWGVQYSGEAGNEWIQYYFVPNGGQPIYSPMAKASTWGSSWKPSPPCPKITPGAKTCSPLAPFDNYMNIIINMAVGGNWGGIGASDYTPFINGVTYSMKGVRVYRA